MQKVIRSWEAIPGLAGVRPSELALGVGVLAVLAVLIVPLPPAALDVGIAFNLGAAGLLLATAITARTPLDLSTFPSLLLGTTVLRLALNVATTRQILALGEGGQIVGAFGRLVAHGDVVLGLVVLVILTLVQLLVVGKGAERVSEVSARFMLDALPGRQMAIDAELRAGTLEPDQAQAMRAQLSAESQFRGAMDGAMKFVKGDAICGVVLTVLNLAAGTAIGVFRFDMTVGQALERFAILTVGDGLVSQVPSLLVALTAGLLATSAGDRELAPAVAGQLGRRPLALAGAAAGLAAAALVSGMPFVPFALVAAGFGAAAWARVRTPTGPSTVDSSATFAATEPGSPLGSESAPTATSARAFDAGSAGLLPALGLDLDPELSAALGLGAGKDTETELLRQHLPEARDAVFNVLGVRVPGLQVRSHAPGLAPGEVEFRLRGVPIERTYVPPDQVLVLASVARLARWNVQAEAAEHPLTGAPAAWVDREAGATVRRAGLQAWTPSAVLGLHVIRLAQIHAARLVGLQEVADLVKSLEASAPDLVRETVPKVVSLAGLTDVVQRLLDEHVSIRDFRAVLEALSASADRVSDPVALTECVRAGLALQIAHDHAGPSGRLSVVVVDSEVEDLIRSAVVRDVSGSHLALDPELRELVVSRVQAALEPGVRAGVPPVLLAEADVRRYLHKLLEHAVPGVVVLSYQELPGELRVEPLDRVELEPGPDLRIA